MNSIHIAESLVPNLAVELYFLVQLLTARGSKLDEEEGIRSLDDDIEDVHYLSSIHNCVYFASSVLEKLLMWALICQQIHHDMCTKFYFISYSSQLQIQEES